jgi:hypothetical protein
MTPVTALIVLLAGLDPFDELLYGHGALIGFYS